MVSMITKLKSVAGEQRLMNLERKEVAGRKWQGLRWKCLRSWNRKRDQETARNVKVGKCA